MLILGCLFLITAVCYGVARTVSASTQEQHVLDDPTLRGKVDTRIEPFAKVAVAGKDNSALEAPKAAGSNEGTVELPGDQAYAQACVACHGSGALGAPKYGNKSEWAPRLAKGESVLREHAIKGFNNMPAKGGRVDLSDKSIIAAVDYMVQGSK
jgi:cytochrome c5